MYAFLTPVRLVVLWIAGLLFQSANVMGAEPYSFPVAVDGYVTLQGRGASGPSWSVPLTVEMYAEGNDFPDATFNVQTDINGAFAIEDTGLDPGNYVISVKNSHTLLIAIAATLNEGSNELTFGSLPEGDANSDNQVTIVDFSILSTSFGLTSGDGGFDPRADFNEDDAVTIQDFSLLSTNFGQEGYVVTADSYSELLAAQGGRASGFQRAVPLYGTYINSSLNDLKIETVSVEIRNEFIDEDRLRVRVLILSGEQPIDGAAVRLEYDHQAMELISIKESADLPLTLSSVAGGGLVDFAAGTFEDLPSGEIELLELEFSLKPNTFTRGISPVTERSAVTYAGKNVLGEILYEELLNPQLAVYPNPGDGLYHIKGLFDPDEEVSYKVTDLNGRIFMEKNATGAITLDLRHIPPGMYLLNADAGSGKEVKRIVKR